MKHIIDCPECQRLWHDYSVSTAAHITLENKLGMAALAHDEKTVSEVAPEVESAVLRRSEARRAIQAHEAAAHTPSGHAAKA